jgi:hypothetical protein
MECYEVDNGRPGVEPVVLLGVLIFQFLERVPDRQVVGGSKPTWLGGNRFRSTSNSMPVSSPNDTHEALERTRLESGH